MEYIEPKPEEGKEKKKKQKIIIASSLGAIALGGIITAYTLLISKVFIDFENVELFHFSYLYDTAGEKEVTIDSIVETAEIPSTLRIPNKLNGCVVTGIGEEAFSYLTEIEEIIFPDTITTIGKDAFKNCTNLLTFNSPRDLNFIGTDAFSGTAWLDNCDDGEVMVGHFLYDYKGELAEDSIIVIDKETSEEAQLHSGDIIEIGKYNAVSDGVFKDQTNLVYAELPENFVNVNNDLFQGCYRLEKVVLSSNTLTIGDSAFEDCEALSDINLVDSITDIGEFAFSNTSLSSNLTLPKSINNLGSGVFSYVKNVEKVIFPNSREDGGIYRIESRLFDHALKLNEVIFPDSEYVPSTSRINSIGLGAFRNTSLTAFKVPYNVSTIASNVFENCKSLKSVTLFSNTKGSIMMNRLVSDDGTYFWAKSSVNTIQGIRSIGSRAFCGEYPGSSEPVKSIFDSLITIDEDGNTSSEGVISLPLTLENLGTPTEDSYMFSNTSVVTFDFSKDFSKVTDATYLATLSDISYIAPHLCDSAKDLVNLDFTGNVAIENIYRGAFANCVNLVSVQIPSSVKSIGSGAFSDCTSITSIDLSDSSSSSINSELFKNCVSLKSYTVSSSVTTISDAAFSGCISLETINFASTTTSNLKDINTNAFLNCESLKTFDFPTSTNRFGNYAFKGTKSFTNVDLSHTILENISESAFEESGVETIKFPSTLKNIGKSTFLNCSSLKEVTLYCEEVANLGDSAFEGASALEKIYVPSSLVDQYKENTNWSSYSSLITAIEE